MFRKIGVAGLTALVFATPAMALEVKKFSKTSASPEAAWAAIGDYCGIADWHPAIEACSVGNEGTRVTRTLTLVDDGGEIVEYLEEWSDEDRSYTYEMGDTALPVADYEATIWVEEGEMTMIHWHGSFEADGVSDEEAKALIDGIYNAGLAGIVSTAEAN